MLQNKEGLKEKQATETKSVGANGFNEEERRGDGLGIPFFLSRRPTVRGRAGEVAGPSANVVDAKTQPRLVPKRTTTPRIGLAGGEGRIRLGLAAWHHQSGWIFIRASLQMMWRWAERSKREASRGNEEREDPKRFVRHDVRK
jgi:hypothetical protein